MTSEPCGAPTVTGAKAPAEAGTSGAVKQRTTKYAADRVTESGQLRLPSCCGSVPAKSISTSSPATVTAAWIVSVPSGASSTSLASKRPSGSPAIPVRTIRSE